MPWRGEGREAWRVWAAFSNHPGGKAVQGSEHRPFWGQSFASLNHATRRPRLPHHQTTVCIGRNSWAREGAAMEVGQEWWSYCQPPTSVCLSHGLPLCQAWHPWEMVLRITPPATAALLSIIATCSYYDSWNFLWEALHTQMWVHTPFTYIILFHLQNKLLE